MGIPAKVNTHSGGKVNADSGLKMNSLRSVATLAV